MTYKDIFVELIVVECIKFKKTELHAPIFCFISSLLGFISHFFLFVVSGWKYYEHYCILSYAEALFIHAARTCVLQVVSVASQVTSNKKLVQAIRFQKDIVRTKIGEGLFSNIHIPYNNNVRKTIDLDP